MRARADIYSEQDGWQAPLIWSAGLHGVLVAAIFIYAAIIGGVHGEDWGGSTSGGGAMSGSPASMDVNFATETLGTAGTVASTVNLGSGVNATKTDISATPQNLTATDAVKFPVKSGTSYELTKFVGVDTALNAMPIVGAMKNVVEAVRGRDFIADRPAVRTLPR